ncbi:MAG: transcriptional regulator [Methylomonas sp.]|nr:MAG: transcriptional regulator [Methylobacter sp.]PPD36216.1 MAG: transcriptional regulator [Methylomonas sp.]
MTAQFIEKNGQREYAVIPVAEYEALLDKAEMLDDNKAFDAALAGNDELIPEAVVQRLLAGENKIKVWREHRKFTQTQLAEQAGIAQATVGQLETGTRTGSLNVLKKIAVILRVDLDDLVDE